MSEAEKDGDATCMASTIMPDHLHFLAILSDRLSISRVVGKFKALTQPAMRAEGLCWQANFFEHRLRPEGRTPMNGRPPVNGGPTKGEDDDV